jgi:hypothetical protein
VSSRSHGNEVGEGAGCREEGMLEIYCRVTEVMTNMMWNFDPAMVKERIKQKEFEVFVGGLLLCYVM